MSDQTTGPDASGDAGTDYVAKYNGLQSAYQKRTNEWAAKEQAFAAEREAYEAKIAKLAEYEARDQAERAERDAEAEYERLSAIYGDPGTPERHGEVSRSFSKREETLDEMKTRLGVVDPNREAWPY